LKSEVSEHIKQFFRDYRLLRIRLIFTNREIEQLKKCGPRYIKAMEYDDMPHSTMVSNTETQFEELQKLQAISDEMQEELDASYSLIVQISLDHVNQATILRLFYIEGKMISEVAKELKLTPEYTSTLKQKAEQNLECVLKGKFKTDFKQLVNLCNS